MGEIIVVAASAYCLIGTIVAIALCSAARGSTPTVPSSVDLAAPETAPAAQEG